MDSRYCFRHQGRIAVANEMVSVGRSYVDEIFEYRDICEDCLKDHKKRLKSDSRFLKVIGIIVLLILGVLVLHWTN